MEKKVKQALGELEVSEEELLKPMISIKQAILHLLPYYNTRYQLI